ncbi:MAG: proprotein convertase P-domain-containing protein [Phycisphaerae bacterium]|nr:proprotein convertase P-domain-containing protein [Phycisphaerae bacterium]
MSWKAKTVLLCVSVLLIGTTPGLAATGDDCTDPIVVNVPGDLTYTANDTTCGRVNDYSGTTCLGNYDTGEDIIYELVVTGTVSVDITVVTDTSWGGIALDDACPPADPCMASDTYASPDYKLLLTNQVLTTGTYYLILDTYATPDCMDFSITIEMTPLGACCLYDGGCVESATEGACFDTLGGCRWLEGEVCTACPALPANDACGNAEAIGEVTDYPFDTTCATNDGIGEYTGDANVWYCYTPTCTGMATISLCGSSYDTKMAVYAGCGCAPLGARLAENDDATGICSPQSQVELAVVAGQQYLIEVGGYSDHVGAGVLTITCVEDADGACCSVAGVCEVKPEVVCDAEGGVYLGNGTTCDGDPCALGACCFDDGSCSLMDATDCAAAVGSVGFLGYGTTCDPNPCVQPGDNCGNPIVVTLPLDLDYADSNTTCGRGNDYEDTCLGYYDSGEDIIYKLVVTEDVCVDITVAAADVEARFGVAIDGVCPPGNPCMDYVIWPWPDPAVLKGLNLTVGTYYVMVDTYAYYDPCTTFDLTITPCPAGPPNDFCADAIDITATPYSDLGVDVPNATDDANVDPSCDTYSNSEANNGVWYTYTPSVDCDATITVSGLDTVTSLWTGADCDNLTQFGCEDDQTSVWNLTAGTKYWIVVSYFFSYAPTTQIDFSFDCVVPDGACCLPDGTCQALSAPDCALANGTFHAGIACVDIDCGGACCQPDETCTDEISKAACDTIGGHYLGDDTTCATTVCNDNCEYATAIGDVVDRAFDTTNATNQGISTYTFGPNIWYCYTATCTGEATVSLCGSSYDTRLAVYDGCTCDPLDTRLAENDDSDVCDRSLQSHLVVGVVAGQEYLIDVGGYSTNAGPGILNISCVVYATGACCVDDVCMPGMTELECLATNGVYLGDDTVCGDPNPCTHGACCFDDGSCQLLDSNGCETAGGDYLGDMTNCDPNPCPQIGDNCDMPLVVADEFVDSNYTCGRTDDYNDTCLSSYDGGEDIIYEWTVSTNGCFKLTLDPQGTDYTGFAVDELCPLDPGYTLCEAVEWGDGTGDPYSIEDLNLTAGVHYIMVDGNPAGEDCIPAFTLTVEICATGACCIDGACSITTELECEAAEGAYLGDDTVCDPNPCNIGACCFGDICSNGMTEEDCTADGGVYQGHLTTCDPNPCVGACCFDDGSCQLLTSNGCEVAEGNYLGGGTTCDPNPCPPANDVCERAELLPVPGNVIFDNTTATDDDTPYCGTFAPKKGVWFEVIGTGNTMTATTCLAGTEVEDTKIQVFCLECGPWTCVAGNDDDSSCANNHLSTVEWCSQLGATYYLHVGGYGDQHFGLIELGIVEGDACVADVQCLPTGACCVGAECVEDMTETECTGLGGYYGGDGSECLPLGACCMCDNTCILTTEDCCVVGGGAYMGDDSNCEGTSIYEADPDLAIPDNNPTGVNHTITVANSFAIDDVNVDAVISHTWIGDLIITVTHNGTTVTLWDQACGGANQDLDVIFDDEGGPVVCDSPTVGDIVPAEALSAFDGMDAAGDWIITVSDNVSGDTGTLDHWSVHLATGASPCLCGDYDRDGDVDQVDYNKFNSCITGPGGTAPADCLCTIDDGDGDIDLKDFAAFQDCFTGPAAP